MTPVFCCGAECGVATPTIGHWGVLTNASFNTSIVRSGSRSLRVNPTAAANAEVDDSAGVEVSSSIHVTRWWVRAATWPDVKARFLDNARGGGGAGGFLYDPADGKVYSYINQPSGTYTQSSTGVALSTGVWYCFDFKWDRSGTTWTVDARIDGTVFPQVSLSGQSAGGANGLLDPFIQKTTAGNVTADIYYDDTVTSLTSADYPIGNGYVHHFVPTSDGTHNIAGTGDFQRTLTGTDILNATTTAFQLIDEVPLEATVTDWINMVAPPNATDYVECVFGPASGIPTPLIAPRAVEVIIGINQAATGSGNMEVRLNDNGTTNAIYSATGVAGVAVATGQQFKRKHYASGPAGAWTVTNGAGNFNNIRIRFGSPAAVDANPDQYLGCAMIEAEFPENLHPVLLGVPYGRSGQRQMHQLLAQ